jgi:O-antigen/teichoic acid export membrane protein
MGIPTGVLRFTSSYIAIDDVSKAKGIIYLGYLVVLLAGIFISVFLFLFSDYINTKLLKDDSMQFAVVAFILFLPFFNLTRLSHFVLRAFKLMIYYSILRDVFFNFLFLLLIVLSFSFVSDLKIVIYSFAISLILTMGINLIIVNRIVVRLKSTSQIVFELKRLLRFSLPIFMVGFAYLLLNQTSKIMIGLFDITENVGIFNAALSISTLCVLFLNSIDAVFAPYISELYSQRNYSKMEEVFKTSARWVFTLTVPVACLFMFFSKEIMMIYGQKFIAGSTILVILSIGYMLNAITGSVAYMLQMTGKQDYELINMIAVVLLNIVLNYFLIPSFGILGAATATSISIASLNVIRLIEVQLLLKMNPYDLKYLKPIIAILFSILTLLFISYNTYFESIVWIFQVLIFMGIYGTILIVLRPEPEDLPVLYGLKRLFTDIK